MATNAYPETNVQVIEKALYCLKHGETESVENWLDLLRERLTENSHPAVRVCAIADIECSRGCGTGACKREQPAAPIDDLRQEVLRLCRLFLDDEQGKYNARAVMTQIFSLAVTPTPSPADERAAYSIEGVVRFMRNEAEKQVCVCCPPGGGHIFSRRVEWDEWQTNRPAHFGNGPDALIGSKVLDLNQNEGQRVRVTVEVLDEARAETGADGAKVDPAARMDWADGILRTLPPLDPTIAIEELLSQYGEDDKEEIFESIKAYADMRARQALSTQYAARSPAMAAEAVAIPVGYALVPIEPTPEIMTAIWQNERDSRRAWERAIATVSQPPAQADARVGLTDDEWKAIRALKGYAEDRAGLIARESALDLALDCVGRLLAAHPGQPEPRAEVTDCGCETNEACKMKTDGSCWRAD